MTMDLVFTTGSTNNAMQCIDVTIITNSARNGDQTFTVILTTTNPLATVGNAVTIITLSAVG